MSDQRLVHLTPEQAERQYFESRRGEVRKATLRTQTTPIKYFCNWLDEEGKEFHQLTGLDVQHFYDSLKDEGYARATLHHYMSAVRQFLLYLERVEAAPEGLADKVHRPVLTKEERKRDAEIEPSRVKEVVQWLGKYHYASRDHIILLLLWRTGIRTGSLRSLDLRDIKKLDGGEPVLDLKHRPQKDTPLKNGVDGERPINLSARTHEALQDYIETNRIQARDKYGRKPLITSQTGRYSQDQIRKTVLLYTCPQTTGIDTCSCSEQHTKETANQCEKSVSPHIIRQASITYWRSQDIPVEVVSDRMNVSRDVIEEHYDRRSKEGKAQQRRKYLNNI